MFKEKLSRDFYELMKTDTHLPGIYQAAIAFGCVLRVLQNSLFCCYWHY
jgi:hypothetical protein